MKSLLPVVLKHITCNISDIVSNTGIIAMITSIIGFDKMLDAYFNNNASIVINSLMEAGEDNIWV